MTQQVSLDAGLIPRASDINGELRRFVLWPFILITAIIAVVAVRADASLTPDQRIKVFLDSGMYP
jgi:hypothetical protein